MTDVLVNGAGEVYVDRGAGLELTDVRLGTEDAVRRLAQRLVADRRPAARRRGAVRRRPAAGRHPVPCGAGTTGAAGDGDLACGCRGGAASPSAQLREAGTLTDESLELVRLVVGARLAFLVTGGTGSGKTTLLSALLGAVDPTERIVVVEDATELRPDHPHVVGLEARPANLEGAGAVPLRDLVRQALRMRPDRLVIGEVRDGAVVDLMAAMNTGHEGGCGTLHANSAADLPARIEALALAAGLGRAAAHSQLASALDVVLHMTRDRDGQRRLSEVAVLERDEAGLVRTVAATRIDRAGALSAGPAAGRLLDLIETRRRR